MKNSSVRIILFKISSYDHPFLLISLLLNEPPIIDRIIEYFKQSIEFVRANFKISFQGKNLKNWKDIIKN